MKTLWIISFLLPLYAWAQYPIGHRNVTYVDSSRSNRQIPTDIYYPATTAGDNTPVAIPPSEGFPVISFGHGFLLNVTTYQYLWEAVVPEGYVMALPRTESSIAPSHLQFGLDLAFLIRKLQSEGSTNGSPFFGEIGITSCVSGHSMGGGASLLAGQSDSSITAIANLAAAETNPSAIAAAGTLTLPALLFAGSNDCVAPPATNQLSMYDALQSDCKTFISINGGSHCKFGENNVTCNLGELTCSGSISRTAQHDLVISYLLPFLDFCLKHDTDARCLFQGRLEAQNGITYQQQCILQPVQDLTIVPSNDGVMLRWSSVSAGCGFEVLRSNQVEFSYDTLLRVYQGPATMFEDTTPGARDYYQVWVKQAR